MQSLLATSHATLRCLGMGRGQWLCLKAQRTAPHGCTVYDLVARTLVETFPGFAWGPIAVSSRSRVVAMVTPGAREGFGGVSVRVHVCSGAVDPRTTYQGTPGAARDFTLPTANVTALELSSDGWLLASGR